jgi:hypothetical protein
MGTRRRTGQAAFVAALLCAGSRAAASVQVEPIARLTLEGGYDSNVMYDGNGAGMGRVSPDLGFRLRDHTWSFGAVVGGDLLTYPNRSSTPAVAGAPAVSPGSNTVWNQRGSLVLHVRPDPRLKIDGEASATYAFDPVGLARLGIFNEGGAGLVVTGSARGAWRLDHDWTVAGTYANRIVRFDQVPPERVGQAGALGAASYTPGVELTKRLGHRLEVGGAYKFDWFQEFGGGPGDATAHELQGVVRWRSARHWTLEATAGPALWNPVGGGALQVVPQASVQLLGANRRSDVRFTLRHGVGLGLLATPGLFDAAEAAGTWNVTRKFQLHADGGLWRSGDIPWGANAITGYGINTDVSYLVGAGVRVGLGASRFARADTGSSLLDRNIVGLRVGWELRHR